jgi:hypothetical protein
MQKAHLYEAILLVNKGIDEAVRGLERLKRTKTSDLNATYFDEELTLFEVHRALLNGWFCSNVATSENRDVTRFEKKYNEYRKQALDEVQVYRDVQAAEERRRTENKPPRVRFLTPEEQHEWEREHPSAASETGHEQ